MKKLMIKKIAIVLLCACLILPLFSINLVKVSAIPDQPKKLDVYFVAGQSNAAGTTYYKRDLRQYALGVDYVVNLTDRTLVTEYEAGYNNVYYCGYSGDGGTKGGGRTHSIKITKAGLGISELHIGPELGMAISLQEKYANSNNDALILKYAVGASSLDGKAGCRWGNWCPPSKVATSTVHGENLYYNMVGHAENGYTDGAIYQYLTDAINSSIYANGGYGAIDFKGLVWLQGEAESSAEDRAKAYGEYLMALINDFRADAVEIANAFSGDHGVNITSNVNLPFVVSEIAPTFGGALWFEEIGSNNSYINTIIKRERRVAELMKNVVTIDTTHYVIKQEYSTFYSLAEGSYTMDKWHYNADDMIEIGVKAGNFFATGYFDEKPDINTSSNSGCASMIETKSSIILSLVALILAGVVISLKRENLR